MIREIDRHLAAVGGVKQKTNPGLLRLVGPTIAGEGWGAGEHKEKLARFA